MNLLDEFEEPPKLKNRFRGYFPVVVDVETAGLNAHTDALLEVCAVTLTMDESGQLHPAVHNFVWHVRLKRRS